MRSRALRKDCDDRRTDHACDVQRAAIRRDERGRCRDRGFPRLEFVEVLDGASGRASQCARRSRASPRPKAAQRRRTTASRRNSSTTSSERNAEALPFIGYLHGDAIVARADSASMTSGRRTRGRASASASPTSSGRRARRALRIRAARADPSRRCDRRCRVRKRRVHIALSGLPHGLANPMRTGAPTPPRDGSRPDPRSRRARAYMRGLAGRSPRRSIASTFARRRNAARTRATTTARTAREEKMPALAARSTTSTGIARRAQRREQRRQCKRVADRVEADDQHRR